MTKLAPKLIIYLFLLFSCKLFANSESSTGNNVLLLNSYHKGFVWTDDITHGIEDAFNKKHIGLHIEYMDTKRQFDSTYQKIISELLTYKHNKHKYSLILTSDDNALQFIADCRNKIFGDIPVVFCGANYFDESNFPGLNNYTGISEVADVESNINLIKELHTTCQKILIITDNSTTGKRVQQEVLTQKNKEENSDIEIELVYDIKMDSLVSKVQNVDENTIIYYTVFFRDKDNTFFEYDESAEIICKNSPVPVYGTWTFSMGFGIVGGYLTNAYDQGMMAGQRALDILNGKNAYDIPVFKMPTTHLQFDYRELEKYDISLVQLEQNAEILYKPLTFFQKNKTLINYMLILIVVMGVFIFFLSYALKRMHHAKKELRSSKNKFESIFLNSPIGILYYNETGIILDCNAPFVKVIGSSRESLIGLNMLQLPDTKVVKAIKDSLKGGVGVYNDYYKSFTANKVTPLRALFQGIKDEKGDVVGGIGMTEDITEQKEAEMEKIHANEKLSAMNEKLVKTSTALKETNDELLKALIEARKSKELERANKLLIKQKEEIRETLNRLKETQSQLIQTEKLASVGILTSGIAHEINNPLNYIQGGKTSIEFYIEDYLSEHLQEMQPYIQMIDEGINRASNIVQSLSHFNRNTDSFNEDCDIHLIIDNCLTMLENRYKHKVQVIKDYHKSGIKIQGNSGKLHQVFLNILSNAEQAIDKTGKVVIKTQISNNKVHVYIKDNGCGMSEENLKKVTDAFYTTKDPGKGTGLGMSIANNIIQDHNGTLKFTSEIDKGTTVKIQLPV